MVSSTVWDQNFMSYDFLSRNWLAAAAAAKLTLCDPRDGSPPGSPVPGILQARILEWVAISFSNAWKWKVEVKSPSRVWLLVTPWTAAYQAPPPMGFSRQEYWSGLPLPSPNKGIFKNQGKNAWYRDFPGGPVAKTPCFQYRGPRFHPWLGS